MKTRNPGLAALLACGVSLAVLTPAAAQAPDLAPDLATDTARADAFAAESILMAASAAEFDRRCDAGLAQVAAQRAALEAETGPATLDGAFRRFDNLTLTAFTLNMDAQAVSNVHVDKPVRDAALACAQRVSDAVTEIGLSRPLYDRLSAIDATGADPEAAFYLSRTLDGYRRAGVDRDEAVRARIAELEQQITASALAFQNNINGGRLEITARPDELEGLPADYVANHPPGEDGRVRISTDYPDLVPVMSYATSEDLRRRLFTANLNRAPENAPILAEMLARRHEQAQSLGHADFAHLITEDKMIGSPANVRAFMAELDRATEAAARRDAARMAARLGSDGVPVWSAGYVQQLLRKEDYDVDPQEVRRYFAYDNVRDGIFRLTEDLFGVSIRAWDAPVWAPGVEAYEMVENGRVIGRFYLDNHPREGKYNHAAVFPIRAGIAGRALPVAALVCNFPAGDHSTGLMEHRDVETFLHEFGHLLHMMFSGQGDWIQRNPMLGLEWDFVEAPSQMLENWVWDYETLSRFAVDAEGNVIPEALVARMNRARGFAEAYGDRRQMGYAAVSLDLHTGAPPADVAAAVQAANNRYSPSPMPDDVRLENSFGHLGGYSAIYYTYLWSKTISTDLFTAFEAEGLRNPETARRYRMQVLAPGSSRPAADLVQGFLGRPVNLDAYRARLAGGEDQGAAAGR